MGSVHDCSAGPVFNFIFSGLSFNLYESRHYQTAFNVDKIFDAPYEQKFEEGELFTL